MSFISLLVVILVVATSLIYVMMTASAASIASSIRMAGPLLLIGAGGILTFSGRGGMGLPLLMIGISLFARNRSIGKINSASNTGRKSTVRSAWLEMELDHDTGEMEGFVLTGHFDGRFLSDMSDEEVLELYTGLEDEAESAALLGAYLDRRIAGWRENLNVGSASGQSGSMSSGPMTKEEAHQILGLEPGAGISEIKNAHRRLMKQLHPDSGGSTFLAAKINQAKDTLLN